MSSIFQHESLLKKKDFYLLSDIFCREIENLLPVTGRVVFWGSDWGQDKATRQIGDKKIAEQFSARTAALQSGIIDDKLILPLSIAAGENVAAIIEGIDPDLLEKMAPEWVMELRDTVQERLEGKRKRWIDPVTGLFNAELLMQSLKEECRQGSSKVLFLICAKNKTRRVTELLPKTVQTGRLIDATTNSPLFYLGGNIFALLLDNLTRSESLKTAHRLLNRLKREGLQSVHIGISTQIRDNQNRENGTVLQECWKALETAERRGTFSLCEGTYLKDEGIHALVGPGRQVVSSLRKKWRGKKQFGLLLLTLENTSADAEALGMGNLVRDMLPASASFIQVSPGEAYIVFPELPTEKVAGIGKDIKQRLEKKYISLSVALGISQWPLLNYSKTGTALNCRKAVMHGRFFGAGSVTVFDHVSLNVSGDYYFDEGDYRQAVRDYRNGVLLAPDDINLLNSLGVALTSLNRIREAVVYFSRVLSIDPDNFMALVNIGFAQRILGDEGKAILCLEKASRHTEFDDSTVVEELSLQLAQLYCGEQSYEKALTLLLNLKRKMGSRQGCTLLMLLGEAYEGTGKFREAVPYFQQVVRMNPHDAKALSLLGKLYAMEEQGDEIALSLCQKAISLDDTSWKNWFHLAMVRFRMGLLDEALAAIQQCLRLNRNDLQVLILAEKIYRQTGDNRKVRSIRNSLIKATAASRKAASSMLN